MKTLRKMIFKDVITTVAFVAYYNLMTVGQSWIASGRISMPAFLLGLHGVVFAIAVAAMLARHYRWSPRQLLPRRAPRGAAA